MSIADLYFDMLQDANAATRDAERRAREANTRACDFEVQLIKHRAAHQSLLQHVRWAADDVQRTQPNMAKRYRQVADEWEKYCAEPQESLGEVASATEKGPANEAGSRAVPEVATQLGASEMVQIPDQPSATPPAIRYSGEWDEVKS